MIDLAMGLVVLSALSLGLSVWWVRLRGILIVISFFAMVNSYIAAPINWRSFIMGEGFRVEPIKPRDPAIEPAKLALAWEAPEQIILKMGCHVCHKIPGIPESRQSTYGPLLIPGTTAPLWIGSDAYRNRVKMGRARAIDARAYIRESILDPDAFIVPGFAEDRDPEVSRMYHFYAERFTPGALNKLTDHLLTVDAHAALEDGLIIGH